MSLNERANEATLLGYQKDLQRLTASLLSAQEADNQELSRELHDVFSQELAALGMEVSTLLESTEGAGPLKEQLTDSAGKLDAWPMKCIAPRASFIPQILDELGLEAALREECRDFFATVRHSGPVHVRRPAGFIAGGCVAVFIPGRSGKPPQRPQARRRNRSPRGAGGCGTEASVSASKTPATASTSTMLARRGGLGLISMEERVRAVNGKFAIHSKAWDRHH